MDIGEKILLGLKRCDVSRKELAEKLGVNPPAVTKWINNINNPPAEKLLKIIKILDLYEEFFPEKFNVAKKMIEDQKLGITHAYIDVKSLSFLNEELSRMREEIEELKEHQQKQTT